MAPKKRREASAAVGVSEGPNLETAIRWSLRDSLEGGAHRAGVEFQRSTRDGAFVAVWSEVENPSRTIVALHIRVTLGQPRGEPWPHLQETVRVPVRDGVADADIVAQTIATAAGSKTPTIKPSSTTDAATAAPAYA